MFVSSRKKEKKIKFTYNNQKIVINEHKIDIVDKFKYLGVIVDQNLNLN